MLVFYGINGYRLTMSNDEAYVLVMAIASGDIVNVPAIASRLAASVEGRRLD